MNVAAGLEMMRAAGLQLQAAFPVAELPAAVIEPLDAAGHRPAQYHSLVIFAHGGTRLWEYLRSKKDELADPFDDTSRRLGRQFVSEYVDSADYDIVYPGPALLPLGRLAELAGWGRPSPLGLTINPDFGLWMAHRVALLVDAPIEIATHPAPHPCDDCVDKPCVAACPVGAVDPVTGFEVASCIEHRTGLDSSCAHQCLARNACPVGAEHRYGPHQMTHHYGASLKTIRNYLESEAS